MLVSGAATDVSVPESGRGVTVVLLLSADTWMYYVDSQGRFHDIVAEDPG